MVYSQPKYNYFYSNLILFLSHISFNDVLVNEKEAVNKYGDNDTFQLFQKLQVKCTYIFMYLILKNLKIFVQ